MRKATRHDIVAAVPGVLQHVSRPSFDNFEYFLEEATTCMYLPYLSDVIADWDKLTFWYNWDTWKQVVKEAWEFSVY